jgi:hypothetical protein
MNARFTQPDCGTESPEARPDNRHIENHLPTLYVGRWAEWWQ